MNIPCFANKCATHLTPSKISQWNKVSFLNNVWEMLKDPIGFLVERKSYGLVWIGLGEVFGLVYFIQRSKILVYFVWFEVSPKRWNFPAAINFTRQATFTAIISPRWKVLFHHSLPPTSPLPKKKGKKKKNEDFIASFSPSTTNFIASAPSTTDFMASFTGRSPATAPVVNARTSENLP